MDSASGLGECLNSQNSMEKFPQKATSPGILVFSRTMQLLHVNRQALELTGQREKASTEPIRIIFSTPVIELRAEVQQSLEIHLAAGIWKPLEVRKMVSSSGRRMLLRGFGLPDRNARDRSRIIIIIEHVALVQEDTARQKDDQLPLAYFQEAVALGHGQNDGRSVRRLPDT